MRAGIALLAMTLILVTAGCGQRRSAPTLAPTLATSGPVESACLTSGRPGVSAEKCGCIQMAANQTLALSDQALGASFFADPAIAHEVRLSDTNRDDAFWERWTEFGEAAEQLCRSA
jgi:hypothetical protein